MRNDDARPNKNAGIKWLSSNTSALPPTDASMRALLNLCASTKGLDTGIHETPLLNHSEPPTPTSDTHMPWPSDADAAGRAAQVLVAMSPVVEVEVEVGVGVGVGVGEGVGVDGGLTTGSTPVGDTAAATADAPPPQPCTIKPAGKPQSSLRRCGLVRSGVGEAAGGGQSVGFMGKPWEVKLSCFIRKSADVAKVLRHRSDACPGQVWIKTLLR